MNRIVKAAVAVTAFGLAAALAVPAQAEVQYDTARHAPDYGGLGEGAGVAGSPLGGLLGGLAGGGLLGGLLGGAKAKSGAIAQSSGRLTEADWDAAIGMQGPGSAGGPNAAEDATPDSGPLKEVSPILGGARLGGGLTKSLPVPALPGAARMAQPGTPSVKTAAQSEGRVASSGVIGQDAVTSVGGLVESYVQGAMGNLSGAGLLPGATRTANVDDLAPLVEEAADAAYLKGSRAAGSYGDLMAALGWSTDALSSSMRDPWARS